jgi:hypothetical protein
MSESIDPGVFHEYAFAIADAESAEYLPRGLVTERLTPKILWSSAHLMPILIDLKRSPVATRDALFDLVLHKCENTEPPPVALLIKTNVSATEISRHWNTMQLAQPQPGRKLWLRLHDPRVLHQLLRILKPMQCKKLFGLSQIIAYWIGGQWVTAGRVSYHSSCLHSGCDDNVEIYAGPERWNWLRIERIGMINRALAIAGISDAALLTSAGALAEQLMERAMAYYGLLDNADLVEFAVRGLTIHPSFDKHPLIAKLIQPDTSSTEHLRLSDRLALVEPDVWNTAAVH